MRGFICDTVILYEKTFLSFFVVKRKRQRKKRLNDWGFAVCGQRNSDFLKKIEQNFCIGKR